MALPSGQITGGHKAHKSSASLGEGEIGSRDAPFSHYRQALVKIQRCVPVIAIGDPANAGFRVTRVSVSRLPNGGRSFARLPVGRCE